jgi:hypothetical protein
MGLKGFLTHLLQYPLSRHGAPYTSPPLNICLPSRSGQDLLLP